MSALKMPTHPVARIEPLRVASDGPAIKWTKFVGNFILEEARSDRQEFLAL